MLQLHPSCIAFCGPHSCQVIEHSENKTITYCESEVGPEVFQSVVQQTYALPKFLTGGVESTRNLWQIFCVFEYLAALELVECWNRALQVRSRFYTAQIA